MLCSQLSAAKNLKEFNETRLQVTCDVSQQPLEYPYFTSRHQDKILSELARTTLALQRAEGIEQVGRRAW